MKNMKLIVMGLTVFLSVSMMGCSSDDPEVDTTAPAISNKTLSFTPGAADIQVAWEKAADETTSKSKLKYKVVYSSSDNISTLDDALDNGNVLLAFTEDITSATLSGLSSSETVYFNVIVKDEAGNQGVYTSGSATTFTCFTGDTLVTMADGSKKRIDQIKPGEKVRSFDKNGDFMVSVVEKVLEEKASKLVTLEAGDKKVTGTETHPFYTGSSDRQSKEYPKYRNMGEVLGNDTLYVEGETSIVPTKVTKIKNKKSNAKVYNLHLGKGPSNFFANGFAVHNGC